MAGVRAVGLRPLLVPAQRGRLRRLGQMHHRADRAQLLDEKPPAGSRLERDLQLLSSEPLKEPAHPDPVRRSDAGATDLAAGQIDPLSGDLRPMLVNTHHDRHPTSQTPRRGQAANLRPFEYVGRRSVPSVQRPAARTQPARAYLCCSTRRPRPPAGRGLTRRPGTPARDMTSFGYRRSLLGHPMPAGELGPPHGRLTGPGSGPRRGYRVPHARAATGVGALYTPRTDGALPAGRTPQPASAAFSAASPCTPLQPSITRGSA